MIVAVAAFSSCSSDDDAAAVNNVDVTGTWKEVAYQSPEGGVWQDYSCDDNIMYLLRYEFTPDGNVYRSPYCEGQEGEFVGTGTYTVQGDILTVASSGENFTYKVYREGVTTLYMQQFYTVEGDNAYYYGNIKLIKE